MAKLTKEDKSNIVQLKIAGVSRADIAEKYEVSTQLISRICHRFNDDTNGEYEKELGIITRQKNRQAIKERLKKSGASVESMKIAMECWQDGYDHGYQKARNFYEVRS